VDRASLEDVYLRLTSDSDSDSDSGHGAPDPLTEGSTR